MSTYGYVSGFSLGNCARMKRLLPFLLLLCSVPSWAAAPVFVNNATGLSQVAGTTVTLSISLTAGNGLVCPAIGAATTGSITLSGAGSMWANVFGSPITQASEGSAQIGYVKSIVTGGTQTITATYGTSNSFKAIWCYQFSGQDTVTFLDTQNSLSSADAVPAVTIASAAANTVMVGGSSCGTSCAGANANCTPNACTNGLSDGSGDFAAMQTNAAGGSTTVQLSTTSQSILMVAATFKGASGGGSTPVCTIALMGAGPC